MSDARPATPAEAPRDEYDRVLCCHGRPMMCLECGEDYAEELAASSGVSAAERRDEIRRYLELEAGLIEQGAKVKALTDALASAQSYMQHRGGCKSQSRLFAGSKRTDLCTCGLEDALTILRRAEGKT